MSTKKKVFIGIIVFILVYVLTFGMSLGSIHLNGILKQHQADVEREVFENTKSYVKGMSDDLAKYKFEFTMSDDEVEKEAIADLIRSRFADFDSNDLNNRELREFLANIRNGNY